MIRLNSTAVTNLGKVRSNNEDNYYVNGKYKEDIELKNDLYSDNSERQNYLFSVCDGMGGEEYGEIASLLAVSCLSKIDVRKLNENINVYLSQANKLICNEIEKNGGARIGTTIALLYIKENYVYCYNIGDSRIYRIRDNIIMQISKDHTQAQSMVDMGLLKAEDMNNHKGKHKLTQHLGIFPDELVIQAYESGEMDLRKDDIYLLCSDGLTDMLTDDEILSFISESKNSDEIATSLVNAAVEKGGKDNTTVIAIRIESITEECQKPFWSRVLKK